MTYDIIIIGAGPAGLTAAIYARRAAKSVLVLEAMTYGGQIINAPDVENYPAEAHISGFDLATKMFEQAKALGAGFAFEKAVGIKDGEYKTVSTSENSYLAKAVIIATGSANRKLGLPGEEELIGRGVSYCASCDGAFFRNRVVAVTGGGNTAVEDALYLSDIAKDVYLIHRRDVFRADEGTVSVLRSKPNVQMILNGTVTKLIADDVLKAIEVTGKNGIKRVIEVNGLFVAIGRVPDNQCFSGVVDLDPSGYVIASENCRTKTPGIFTAGDVRVKDVRQLVTATADGAVAATEAARFASIGSGA